MSLSERILIVDDDEHNVMLLSLILEEAGFTNLVTTMDPFEAAELFASSNPDLVISDLHMPGLSGFTLIGELRSKIRGTLVPIVVITADVSSETKERALRAGASDFLTKPFDRVEVALRVRNLLEVRQLQVRLEHRNRSLDEQVSARTKDLEQARLETLDRLAIAAEYRDDATGQHARRVGLTSRLIAEVLGLPELDARRIGRAAQLHDIGKIGIPDWILLKPAPLTPEEFEKMKTHTAIGARILENSTSGILQTAREIAFTHHERWDGRGYQGLEGTDIPLTGRIVALADAFDAMTWDRPYRQAKPIEFARAEVEKELGHQFDPVVVDAFRTLPDDALRLKHQESLAN